MSATVLTFTLHADGSRREVAIPLNMAVIAGWTGRDKVALEKHIRELEELGVQRPASTPIYYRVAAARFTQADRIECTGPDSSGEAEFLLVEHGGRLLLGIGSDHTDRKVETYNITVSKQMCDKPVGRELWALDEVMGHWDRLILRAHAVIAGERVLYQEGSVAAMLPPRDILDGFGAPLKDGAMMCGTLAAHGGIRPAERFEFELEDPVLGRTLRHAYDVVILPVMG